MRNVIYKFFIIVIIVIPLSLIVAISLHSSDEKRQPDCGYSQNDIHERYFDDFAADSIYIQHRGEDNQIQFSLSADKIIHRKRISKFFIYQNLKEIYMTGAKIDFFNSSNKKLDNSKIEFNDIQNSLMSLGKPTTPIEDFIKGKADIDMDLLTRVLFDNLYMNINFVHNNKISIRSTTARLNAEFQNILFEGMVKIVALDGKEFNTSQAVWSKKYNGIYFPKGYAVQNDFREEEAFFAVNHEGKFSKASTLPKIKYEDTIEEKEEIFYAQLYNKMPSHIRSLMMGNPSLRIGH